ncbi:MAG: isoprenylcysteine carboxylmethyltransferase family protein [Pirellulaceae bacterium]|nr:isoprenylcysteine carboxylmethyltransferase family protein [Pirellulaceae bacterium]
MANHANTKWLAILAGSSLHGLVLLTLVFAIAGTASVDRFVMAVVIQMILFGVIESVLQCTPTTLSDVRDRTAIIVGYAMGILFMIAIVCALLERHHAANKVDRPVWFWMGVLLSWTGAMIRNTAIWQLGPRFTSDIILAHHETICRAGIYRWLRHPGELGFLFVVLGMTIQLHSPWTSLLALFIFLPHALWRMRREDHFLAIRRQNLHLFDQNHSLGSRIANI